MFGLLGLLAIRGMRKSSPSAIDYYYIARTRRWELDAGPMISGCHRLQPINERNSVRQIYFA
jgi:hypothetical protein